MFAIIVINSEGQDPGLLITMYAAFSGLGWTSDDRIPFTFWKEFAEGDKPAAEDEISQAIVNADWDPFDYLLTYASAAPVILHSN